MDSGQGATDEMGFEVAEIGVPGQRPWTKFVVNAIGGTEFLGWP